uniref:VWFD domain-containing protein n=1 Tax=Lates calcarifer TaxID=8187 RepID=A0A4W6DD37_LATCA
MPLEWLQYSKCYFLLKLEVRPSHNDQFCSTWGNYHFKTFDGDFFQLPYTCNYILTSQCKDSYENFNIQLQRQEINGVITIKKLTMKLNGVVVDVSIPFSRAGISIRKSVSYVKIKAKLGLVVMWNQKDALWVELDAKFKNQTCGLCGDFNGSSHLQQPLFPLDTGDSVTAEDYGEDWKLNGPTEDCEETSSTATPSCETQVHLCENLLSGPAFLSCQNLIDTDSFIKACVQDLCKCNSNSTSCLCSTISEYSRQCAHAGGNPQQWKTAQLCARTCPFNMEYRECGSPCTDTCTDLQRSQVCEEHCIDGCFCPPGTVFDDISQNGCIAADQCSCLHNGNTYKPGESYSTTCRSCTCTQGEWICKDLDCPGICSILGGSHISTYDDKTYTFHGDCSYLLSKVWKSNLIYPSNDTHYSTINKILRTASFSPSTFFIVIHTTYGLDLEIQLTPIMQVYIKASYLCPGLCGDFNDVEADDFRTTNGLIEGTAGTFANTWKTKPSCPDVTPKLGDPCTLSIKFAKNWCSLLSDPRGIFANCHSEIDPETYEASCIYDTCACENSEMCMCAAISSYVHACAAEGILLNGWRDTVCKKYTTDCPSTLVYDYQMESCGRTCRSLSQSDSTCEVKFTPLDGCGCAEGTYLNEKGECVSAPQCSCHVGETVMHKEYYEQHQAYSGFLCNTLSLSLACTDPMVFFNCSSAKPGDKGSECQNSCQTLDTECVSTECISGCVCPAGLLSDGKGGCVEEEDCPCPYNGQYYNAEQTVKVDCNTCTCKNRNWICTDHECDGTCTIYGEGHYITFDDKRFSFNGDCGYVFTQDYCGDNNSGTFRVLTESIPCGTTESICSTAIKLYLGNKEFVLSEENIRVIQQNNGEDIPYHINTMGIYLVIEAKNGLVLIWNKKTTLMIKLSSTFKGRVCGLCGNYDGNIKNDFTTRSKEVVVDALVFGNSWKVSPTCPNANSLKNPCSLYSHRQAWAIKHCSIINSEVFSICHSKVDPQNYYDACVRDTCACNTGGDCECFCSAVAAYAAACDKAGACVKWRTPTICPVFCDFYNPDGECEWHYEPCGKPCMKTCRNPSGICYNKIPPLEGCYPRCPPERPYLEQATMKCVSKEECGCYDDEGNHYEEGKRIPSKENSCTCTHKGRIYKYGDKIYETHDGDGTCISAVCGKNGTTIREITPSPTEKTTTSATTGKPITTTKTQSTAATEKTTTSATTEKPITTTPKSTWSDWTSNGYPDTNPDGGEYETLDKITDPDLNTSTQYKDVPLNELDQKVTCNPVDGLICHNKDQSVPFTCFDYEIRVKCCINMCNTKAPTTTEKPTVTESPTTTTTITEKSTTAPTEKTTTSATTGKPITTTTTQSTAVTEKPSTKAPTTTEKPTVTESPTTTTTITEKSTTAPTEKTTTSATTGKPITTTTTQSTAATEKPSTKAPTTTEKPTVTESPTTTTTITEKSTTAPTEKTTTSATTGKPITTTKTQSTPPITTTVTTTKTPTTATPEVVTYTTVTTVELTKPVVKSTTTTTGKPTTTTKITTKPVTTASESTTATEKNTPVVTEKPSTKAPTTTEKPTVTESPTTTTTITEKSTTAPTEKTTTSATTGKPITTTTTQSTAVTEKPSTKSPTTTEKPTVTESPTTTTTITEKSTTAPTEKTTTSATTGKPITTTTTQSTAATEKPSTKAPTTTEKPTVTESPTTTTTITEKSTTAPTEKTTTSATTGKPITTTKHNQQQPQKRLLLQQQQKNPSPQLPNQQQPQKSLPLSY